MLKISYLQRLNMSKKVIQEAAREFVCFVNKGPSPYHVVDECKSRLLSAGFTELRERDSWSIDPLGKYFVINNFSTIIAFAVGGKFKPGNGFSIVGAHTDSPCLKVKPRSCRTKYGYVGVGVQCYGGGIWHTWFDRDLKLAGRAMVKKDGGLVHRLVHIDEPILRVPNICIHLQRDHNDKFGPNKETHIIPVLATTAQEKLEGIPSGAAKGALCSHHPPMLQWLLSNQLNCKPDDILDFELFLADHQPATLGGALKEFIFAPRIDNLMNCYTGLQGLVQSMDSLPDDKNVRMLCLYDNEEVGSTSTQGAQSSITEWILRRISAGTVHDLIIGESVQGVPLWLSRRPYQSPWWSVLTRHTPYTPTTRKSTRSIINQCFTRVLCSSSTPTNAMPPRPSQPPSYVR
ncbi:aspartyl aminopeptidase-like isoform X2 [Halichondria panicea]|uniref:aspartyl aminopeptidase-like isoform X2 n=1 Tax=Halichondria panicea TaxID=6063 RepID=UPI00312B492C